MITLAIEHTQKDDNNYPTALLIKDTDMDKRDIEEAYIRPLNRLGIISSDVVSLSLEYFEGTKPPNAKKCKEYLTLLLQGLRQINAKTLLVADSTYFKILTGIRKVEAAHGYIHPCVLKGYEGIDAILSVNYKALFYNPNLQSKLNLSIHTLAQHMQGVHKNLGVGIIHSENYPQSLSEIDTALEKLSKKEALTCDIETFGLKVNEAGIATIAFAWDKHSGIAFGVDRPYELLTRLPNEAVRSRLRNFFRNYKGRLIYHNGNFDIKILIWELFMDHPLDYEGAMEGMEIMFNKIHDTKLITYLATNTTSGNDLKLKTNAFEFAGNWAQDDIKDITKIPLPELLRYNLVDCLATWYVLEKNYPVMVQDNQENLYNEIFIPSMRVICHMELVGMPIDMNQVRVVEQTLKSQLWEYEEVLQNSNLIMQFEKYLQMEACITKQKNLKKKKVTVDDFAHIEYNPNSNKQTALLLYEELGFEPIDFTDTGQPAVGAKTLKKLLLKQPTSAAALTDLKGVKEILKSLIGIAEVSIILNTFINAFYENSFKKSDGIYYLHGNFNLGGTVSGRLSSSKPNLQNIPVNSKYGKLIKTCFIAPPGWLLAGADYWSLEDRISALTTKDPNKLKVYEEGYDGHCLRAYSYFGDQMPDILHNVASINSIETKYPHLRQDSKGPTFALTYQGTWHTLVNNLGLTEVGAKQIENRYHQLYKVSDEWVAEHLEQATKDGYVTGAFGLRLRTPILGQTLLGRRSTPYQSKAEGRTAGNMLGQSWGMLNNRSGIEFHERLLASKHRFDIMPICQIHDSQYFLVRDQVGTFKWFNDNLAECLAWQNHPDIKHPTVKLGGDCCIYYPNWSKEIKFPNHATKSEILEICDAS